MRSPGTWQIVYIVISFDLITTSKGIVLCTQFLVEETEAEAG